MYKLNEIKVIRDDKTILDIDSLTIDPKGFTVILGHNGSGKSTLVNLLAKQFAPEHGEIELNGQPISTFSAKALAKEVAYLPQKLPEVAGLNVKELVRLGRYPWRGVFGQWNSEDNQIIETAMMQTQVDDMSFELADQLSGGEKQRAWIAMLLAQQSNFLILDEPTSALDVQHQYQVMSLLKKLNQESGKGVLVILHDLNLALRFASHVIALKQGKVLFQGEHSLLLDEQRLSALYNTPVSLIDHPKHNHKVAIVC
ncbi:Iron(3+)-hydroxamate import ATP-binding protein fhuC [Vibrio nigripulchritudo MADA3029]|uniref:Iron(3+)-hydroxamate import ATP-binding protein fhuC n=1 Tax=Vibrio nigripulchritudo SOn1 TaxID=1238450 RepID=A0AAV2VIB3_9VIBR|nr:ABC transporter ATP-binding protein [Vibrio nigripulchritudo]CCN47901.1 Iron(3+)-hydroxamate import ATP-binding protein fhuC [Vibrio nigripulchritudo MADA3020]CCN51241.1 Iron(3+)-hydroxamate import ATP-binding protein fhuC [Vibrio nigripulchritudo MADA3021]CCN60357.1 Iron(3+)-hydroxamate import ATP-binding protein fhuC [Vibrio nigripulchritudo MADA3029]CCO44392.1 Iron(3+)-hydroxamate import ATP-binding protein fhuC [Vibrio nigripulchritudo SOn1]BCL70598.1 ABC transporter [Vibrio nigripulchr